jgi:UDP-N-acetylglucosamine--N-acetylmuramyl-(pentapeptide) pyrophosphoryl-undecaprenol N-acetylglucosamine transferase
MKVLIVGGGTAGHVFPALALARRLREDHGADVRFAGTATGQEARLIPDAGFAFSPVEARPLVRRLSLRTVTAPAAALRSVARCRPLVEDADVVVGMGGYVSVPVALAAIRARRPLVLHEQNAVPGLANRTLARPARAVALSFAEAGRMLPRRVRTVVTGNPVREEILAVRTDREALAKEAREEMELEEGRTTVLVFGGSQGALHVNRATLDALHHLHDRWDLQVLLLTGPTHVDAVRRGLPPDRGPLTRALPFVERMDLAYAVADLVVSRAGATTCAEVTVCGLPALLVPYPYATGRHQEANARALQRAGAATIVMDDALSGPLLAARLADLLDHRDRLARMAERSTAWGSPGAATALAHVVAEAGGAA